MSQEKWTAVDDFYAQHLLPPDPALDAALKNTAASGLPPIQVASNQGKLLMLLAAATRAEKVLEIGTLGGFSTICLARGVGPAGHVTTLELDPHHAEVARKNIAAANLDNVTIRVGPAIETLPKLLAENVGPFDLVFIDADKESSADYFAWALKLSRTGTLILIDNVARAGAVADEHSTDPGVIGTRKVLAAIGREPRVSATAIQTVGHKGYDGLAIALVID